MSTDQHQNSVEEKHKEIDSLVSAFPDGKVPESPLGKTLDNMVLQWNSMLTQVITEVDHTQPILEHIKETAEFTVKQFKDACLDMNSELTRISVQWQHKNPSELAKQEIADYEKSIERQKNLLERIGQKIDNQINPIAMSGE